jgi:SAM-dependent methyltransferase
MPLEADRIIELYRRHARAWTIARGETLIEQAWIDRFLALTPTPRRVLDIGCGPGRPIAAYMKGKGCTVTGVDSSPEMIAMFRANVLDADTHVSDMRDLQLSEVFEGLLAWDSFFHLAPADQRCMFPIFRRHSAAGAALMFTSGPEAGEAIGLLEGEPLYHASLAPAEYRSLLEANGFHVAAHVAEDETCGTRTVWLARRG